MAGEQPRSTLPGAISEALSGEFVLYGPVEIFQTVAEKLILAAKSNTQRASGSNSLPKPSVYLRHSAIANGGTPQDQQRGRGWLPRLLFEQVCLIFYLRPFIRIGRRGLPGNDRLPIL